MSQADPREMTTPNCPVTVAPQRVLRDDTLTDERAVLPEHLNAVAAAIADVDHAVAGDLDTGHVAERSRRLARRAMYGPGAAPAVFSP